MSSQFIFSIILTLTSIHSSTKKETIASLLANESMNIKRNFIKQFEPLYKNTVYIASSEFYYLTQEQPGNNNPFEQIVSFAFIYQNNEKKENVIEYFYESHDINAELSRFTGGIHLANVDSNPFGAISLIDKNLHRVAEFSNVFSDILYEQKSMSLMRMANMIKENYAALSSNLKNMYGIRDITDNALIHLYIQPISSDTLDIAISFRTHDCKKLKKEGISQLKHYNHLRLKFEELIKLARLNTKREWEILLMNATFEFLKAIGVQKMNVEKESEIAEIKSLLYRQKLYRNYREDDKFMNFELIRIILNFEDLFMFQDAHKYFIESKFEGFIAEFKEIRYTGVVDLSWN